MPDTAAPDTKGQEFVIKKHRSWGSVWKAGELIGGREKDGTFYAVIEIKERVVGPRGGIREPAVGAIIRAATERGVFAGIRELGFSVPRSLHLV